MFRSRTLSGRLSILSTTMYFSYQTGSYTRNILNLHGWVTLKFTRTIPWTCRMHGLIMGKPRVGMRLLRNTTMSHERLQLGDERRPIRSMHGRADIRQRGRPRKGLNGQARGGMRLCRSTTRRHKRFQLGDERRQIPRMQGRADIRQRGRPRKTVNYSITSFSIPNPPLTNNGSQRRDTDCWSRT